MRYIITGKNIEVTPSLREAVKHKFSKLEKYFTDDTEVRATLIVQKDSQKIEVTIPTNKGFIRAEQESGDMYSSIDAIQDIIEKQIKRYKNKLVDKKHDVVPFSDFFLQEDYTAEESDEINIAKVKRFSLKPMDPEEACLQMELLNHSFYVFINSETDNVSVVYKRKNGTYGLIEPEV
jgi:ribosomal subunit interface protein